MNQATSAAAQIIVSIIPIVGIGTGGVVAFFFLLWNHRQKMRLIEQGISPPGEFDLDAYALLAGLLTTAVGTVLTLFFALMEGISYVLLGGLIPLAVGAGLLLFCRIRSRAVRD